MSNLKKKFIVVAIITTLALAGFGTSTVLASNVDVTPDATNVQVDKEAMDNEPEAFPAVVGAAVGLPFVAGAANEAGKKVGGWVADKIIGIWSVDETVSEDVNFDVIFD